MSFINVTYNNKSEIAEPLYDHIELPQFTPNLLNKFVDKSSVYDLDYYCFFHNNLLYISKN